jgi:glycosyltransferase involved in cell wall biosynthesis
MYYIYRHLPMTWNLNILAVSTHENEALKKDAEKYRASVHIVEPANIKALTYEVSKRLLSNQYDIIISNGIMSAVSVTIINYFRKVPHILTIHGIIEPKYFEGYFGKVKRLLLLGVFKRISIIYAVSNDILEHVLEELPELRRMKDKFVMIPNGIEISNIRNYGQSKVNLRTYFGLDEETFLFGFFGRFMCEKGFDLIIDAIGLLSKEEIGRKFAVVAVGSGDYIREYQTRIAELNLDQYFNFLPFRPNVIELFPQINTIVMPSRWEAAGLVSMEALAMGRPLIASDCLGLREIIFGTPAMVFPTGNVFALANLMKSSITNNFEKDFASFAPIARSRYDVRVSAKRLIELINSIGTAG